MTELPPHEWVPPHHESVWLFDTSTGEFKLHNKNVVIHISHNGDFDAIEAYSQTMVINDIGLWLERVLNTKNSTKGDSPKLAGCFDLFRVQGRWSAAARVAWIKCVFKSSVDVSGGKKLSKNAPNTCPKDSFWHSWGHLFEFFWKQNINNIIKRVAN